MISSSRFYHRSLILKSTEIFKNLSNKGLNYLGRVAKEKSYAAGQFIAAERESSNKAYVVISGEVEITYERGEVTTVGASSAFGVISTLADKKNHFSAKAKRKTWLLEISASALNEVLADDFNFLLGATSELAQRTLLRRVEAQIANGFDNFCPVNFQQSEVLTPYERIRFFSETPIFVEGTIEPAAEIALNCELVDFAPGETIWKLGEPSKHWFFIFSGSAKAEIENKETYLGRGNVAGALEVFARQKRWYTLQAMTKVSAFEIDQQKFIDILEDRPKFAIEVCSLLSKAFLGFRGAPSDR